MSFLERSVDDTVNNNDTVDIPTCSDEANTVIDGTDNSDDKQNMSISDHVVRECYVSGTNEVEARECYVSGTDEVEARECSVSGTNEVEARECYVSGTDEVEAESESGSLEEEKFANEKKQFERLLKESLTETEKNGGVFHAVTMSPDGTGSAYCYYCDKHVILCSVDKGMPGMWKDLSLEFRYSVKG